MKNIFSRKHDTQTGNSKYKFWIPGSTRERSTPRPVPIQTDNTHIQDIRTSSSRAASQTNLQPSAAEDKLAVSTPGPSVEKTIYPTTRAHTVPQANLHPSRPSSSKHRDNAKYEPPWAGYLSTFSHEREDLARGFRRVPSGNELAPKNRTDLWPPESSKQPGPLDDRYREQPFHENTRPHRNEDNDARYGIRMESSKPKEPRGGVGDRFRVFREEYATLRERHVTTQRPRDKDRARESEPEGIREKEKDKVRQRERERHQREYEKERERNKGERQQRESEREQVRQQEVENERERERQNELEREREREKALEKEKEKEKQRERQKELERERQREEKERQRQQEERERQREEKERQRQQEERERQREEKERQRQQEERERQRQKDERQRERQRELEKEREKERERQKELERERLKEERERERQLQREKEVEREWERERERQKEEREQERQMELEKERQTEADRLERERLKEERRIELERERERERQKEERERERQKELEKERQKELERERLKEERERERRIELERERERERQKEEREQERQRELEKERQKVLERERLKEERERERRIELERERERERQKEERERERQRELEKERQKVLERERLKEERERERRIELERERERERQRELEKERQKEVDRLEWERLKERERQVQREREMERERRMALERERERERQKEERERERQRDLEKERQKELERERLKEERERQMQREMEREREMRMELEREQERERQKEERERERQRELEKERQKEVDRLERERLKEERRIELERERERERQKEERERERQRELEKERAKETDRQKGLEREKQRVFEKERERLQELERERQRELERERQRELERERERQRELERERERQKELERDRLREEKERERQRQKELERELERQREQERQKEDREREYEKQKELQRLKDHEQERLKELEQQREIEKEKESRGKDRGRREMARHRTRERERRDQGEHEYERLHHEDREREKQQESDILVKPSIVDLKPKHLDHRVDPSQRDSDKAEGIIKAGLKTVETRPVGDGEYRKEKDVKDPRQDYRQAKARPEPIDGNKDRLRTKTGWDRERRKEGKLGRLSEDQPSRGLRTFRQLRHERPVADGWGDSSDDSVDQVLVPQSGPKHDRTDDEKVPQPRQDNSAGGWNILAPGNEFRPNQAPINLPPPYATPRAAPKPLTPILTLTGRHAVPLASDLVNIGTSHDNESVRREINWPAVNQEDAEPLKPTESSRPPSRVSLMQGINPIQSMPPQTLDYPVQLKDVQPSSRAKARPEDFRAQNVHIGLPVNTVLNSWSNIAQEAGRSQFPQGDDKGLKTFPDSPMESSKEAQVSSMKQMGSQQNDTHQGTKTRATPAPIILTLPTEVHPTQMQSEEKMPHIAPSQVQNSTTLSVPLDIERHQDPLAGSNTTDVPDRTRVSLVTTVPNLGISVLDSVTPGMEPRTQVLASPSILHPLNYQPPRNFTNILTPATVNSAPQVRPSSSYGNYPAIPTAPSSQKPKLPHTNAFLSPHNRESASLPVPSSETVTNIFSSPVNASPHIHIPQSGAGIPTSVETSFLAKPPMMNWDRNVTTRPEIRQFVGSKADSPVLPGKDESAVEKYQFVQTTSENMAPYSERVAEQRPPTLGAVNKVNPHGDHSIPSIAEAPVAYRIQYHDVEPSRLDNITRIDLNNHSRVVGPDPQVTTRPGTEIPVLEKNTEKPSASRGNGRADVLTSMAPSGPTPSTYGVPVKYWERPFSNPMVDTQGQQGPTEPGHTVSPYVGRDASGQQTSDIPRNIGKPGASGNNHTQEANDKEQIGLSIGRPSTSSGYKKSDPNNHHHKVLESQPLDQTIVVSLQGEGSGGRPPARISWKKGPNEAISEEHIIRHDARGQNQDMMVNGLKTDHSRGPDPPHASSFGTQTVRQLPGSVPLQVTHPIGTPARLFDKSPRRSLLPQTGSNVSPDLNTATQPKEVAPLVKEGFSRKVDAVSFSQTPGVVSDGITSNALFGLKKGGPSARQWVAKTPMTAHSLLPINMEGPGKHYTYSPSAHDSNAEHVVPSSATIPPHSEIREPQFANLILEPPHATVSTTLESSLTRVEIVPQIKISHPITAGGSKQGMEVTLSSRTPTFFGAPETAAVTSIPPTPPALQTLDARKKASFDKGPVGVSSAKSRNQHNESPETKLLKVDDAPVSSFAASTRVRSDDFGGQAKKRSSYKESPRIKKAEPTLTRVLLRDTDELGRRKPTSKKSPKVMATIGNEGISKQDVDHNASSRQDKTEQLRSSKLSTQPLPVIARQADENPQTKIQHPILAELLSSPETAPVQLTPVRSSDRGYPKEVHLSSTTPSIQSKLHGTPPERNRQEPEKKMQPTMEAPISRSSHRKHSTAELPPLREHHQLPTAVDVMTRAKLSRTGDQVDHDRRKNMENSNLNQASQGNRVMSQDHNSNHRIPGTTMASHPVQQPLQHTQGRQQHLISVPTSSILENAVKDMPGSIIPPDYAKQALAQGRTAMGGAPDKQILSGSPPAPQEAVPMTPASFAPSLALKPDSRQSNAESINSQTGKKIRRFRLPSTQATTAQSFQVWHPRTSSKTPNSSPSQSSGTPLEHNLNPNEPTSVPFPTGKDAEAAIVPFKYLTHRKKRSVSGASMEARDGAPSTIVGSPNASMRSGTPLPPPPTRDAWKATHDWVSKTEDRAQSRPKRKRPRPGVVFDTDEDAPEDKQRPRRTLTKHRSAAKRHESPTS